MQPEERKALIFELADTVLKSWWTVVAGVCFGVAGAVVALNLVTSYYQAAATMYVTPEISRDLGRPLVAEDMTRRMSALQDAVLTEDYMRRMIHEVYGREPETDEKFQDWRKLVQIRAQILPTAVGGGVGHEALYAFDLAYIDTDPDRAALAANTLAKLFIEQNQEFRSKQARDATQAAADAAERARVDFEAADLRLADFRQRHAFETGDHQNANLRLLERRQEALKSNLDATRAADNRLQDLAKELADTEVGAASFATQVAQLRSELADLLNQYSEAHPSVRRVQTRLEELLRARGVSESDPPDTDSPQYPPDPRVLDLRAQIAAAQREVSDLDQREATLRQEIGELERRIEAVPTIQPQLARLTTEHDMLRERYERAQNKADQAQQALFLEEALRGERFELAERATPPKRPIYPQPVRFYALGLMAGCALFVGPLLARRFLNPVISSEAGLCALLDIPVLVSIPRIVTPATRGAAIRRNLKNVILSTLCLVMAVTTFVFLG